MHWLSQGLRTVKFRWNQVSSWQHRILKRNLLLILYRRKKKKKRGWQVVCFLLPLKREIKKKKKKVWLLQPISSVWGPLAKSHTKDLLSRASPTTTFLSLILKLKNQGRKMLLFYLFCCLYFIQKANFRKQDWQIRGE